ncbi:hypothetical protein SAMCFNEI73_Ch2802 [Sinorhizobium americanum]|uniref:Uncharacterized protein n=1 Tax=Sinorhizobium americanum TaxID=194963 RepID=A0A1L3LPS3_9HYPH|nr:hypothetical protein SAMCCGM7_Ch2680 [Sinorhizobium americanum CCGM7]APG92075.1 hypothetical protein SAMCFNEI73_Ch2802 [Sinorhizobium americanum]
MQDTEALTRTKCLSHCGKHCFCPLVHSARTPIPLPPARPIGNYAAIQETAAILAPSKRA